MSKNDFKTHMVRYADNDGFRTMCGIDDSCSEDFYYTAGNIVQFGRESETTCKRCLASYRKEMGKHKKRIAELEELA